MCIIMCIIIFYSPFNIIYWSNKIDDSPLRCSHAKSSKLRRDDHDKFDEASQQGEAECESSDERQSIQPESAV